MKDQSHKDEMAAALRGDFERLRERGVAATLGPVDGSTEPVEPQEHPPPEPSRATPRADEPSERRGLFGRLFGR